MSDKKSGNSSVNWKAIGTVLGAIAALIAIFGAVKSCTSPLFQEATGIDHSPWLGLQFWQNKTQDNMYPEDNERTVKVSMKREPFQIQVPDLGTAKGIQICAWTDDSVFNLQNGERLENVRCLGPGHGGADTSAGSSTLFLSKEAFNYYPEERINQNQISVASTVAQPGGTPTRLQDQDKDLYLTVFLDKNNNRTVDNGEYEYVVLDF